MVRVATVRERTARASNRTRAKSMRHDPVYVERFFWTHIRDRKLGGWKFRRQVLIGPYIADYVCAQKRLVVELDGGIHKLRKSYDKARDDYFIGQRYIVLHFTNEEVMRDLQSVLEKILRALDTAP